MKVMVKGVRVAFPSVHKAFKGKGQEGDGKFNIKGLLAKDSPMIAVIEAAMLQVAEEKWPKKGKQMVEALRKVDKLCIHDGDTKMDWEGFEGNMFISASSATKPSVFDQQRNEIDSSSGAFYSGCYANVSVEVWAQENDYGKRINMQLRGVQKVRDGDAFAGGSRPADQNEFEDEIDAPDEEDLTA
jgi:Protein of unknown function (DUF2815)